jgi:hypothetical protein
MASLVLALAVVAPRRARSSRAGFITMVRGDRATGVGRTRPGRG